MSIFTKSIQGKINKSDGVRICIMRRPDRSVSYDIWMPILAPSGKLLTDFHKKKVIWPVFEERFRKEVIKGQRKYLLLFVEMALKRKITILCWEKTPKHCHRRLVAEECKKMNKKLKVVIK